MEAKQRAWTTEEDSFVFQYVLAEPDPPFTRWAELAGRISGRNAKQVRGRWTNYLNPAIIHSRFSWEDDMNLWNGHKELGNRWVEIGAKVFNSTRSENQVKNRWYSAGFKEFVATEFGEDAYKTANVDKGQGIPLGCEANKADSERRGEKKCRASANINTHGSDDRQQQLGGSDVVIGRKVTAESKAKKFAPNDKRGKKRLMLTKEGDLQFKKFGAGSGLKNARAFNEQWTPKEDAIISKYVLAEPNPPFTRWADLAFHLPGRSNKQIRDHWNNYLNPSFNRLPFSWEDDMKLWDGHKLFGNHWVDISVKVFHSSRSENQVKNRWYSKAFKEFAVKEFGADAYSDAKKVKESSVSRQQREGRTIIHLVKTKEDTVEPTATEPDTTNNERQNINQALGRNERCSDAAMETLQNNTGEGQILDDNCHVEEQAVDGAIVHHLREQQTLMHSLTWSNKIRTIPGLDASYRSLLLAMPGDEDCLTDMFCTLRNNIEVFTATDADARKWHANIQVGQVGLRCIYCTTRKCYEKVRCATCYPVSIAMIYRTVVDMKLKHFFNCPCVPNGLKSKLENSPAESSFSSSMTVEYFSKSAREIGMMDVNGGVFIDLNRVRAFSEDADCSPALTIFNKPSQVVSSQTVVTLEDTNPPICNISSQRHSKEDLACQIRPFQVKGYCKSDEIEGDQCRKDGNPDDVSGGIAAVIDHLKEELRLANYKIDELNNQIFLLNNECERMKTPKAERKPSDREPRIPGPPKAKTELQQKMDILVEINAKLMKDNLLLKRELDEKVVLVNHYRKYKPNN